MNRSIPAATRRTFLVAGGATVAGTALAACSDSGDERAGPSDPGGPEVVEHLWVRDGVKGFTNIPITVSAKVDAGPNLLSAKVDRGRIRSTAGSKGGNQRECWLRAGTTWADSEITSLWYPPSGMDPATCTPQMGHVHRVSNDGGKWSGVVIDQNVFSFLFRSTFMSVWTWGPGGFTIPAKAALAGQAWAIPIVRGVQRVTNELGTFRVYLVDRLCGVEEGDTIDVAGCEDQRFNGTNLHVHGVTGAPKPAVGATGPTIYVRVAEPAPDIAQKPQGGYVTLTPPSADSINPRSIYPMWVTSRVVGSTVMLKKWYGDDPEPIWGDPEHTKYFEIPKSQANRLAERGACGLLSNHLRNDGWIEYGDAVFRKL